MLTNGIEKTKKIISKTLFMVSIIYLLTQIPSYLQNSKKITPEGSAQNKSYMATITPTIEVKKYETDCSDENNYILCTRYINQFYKPDSSERISGIPCPTNGEILDASKCSCGPASALMAADALGLIDKDISDIGDLMFYDPNIAIITQDGYFESSQGNFQICTPGVLGILSYDNGGQSSTCYSTYPVGIFVYFQDFLNQEVKIVTDQNDVINALNNQHPLLGRIEDTLYNTSGHLVAVIGYEKNNQDILIVNDPLFNLTKFDKPQDVQNGEKQHYPFSDFGSNGQYRFSEFYEVGN